MALQASWIGTDLYFSVFPGFLSQGLIEYSSVKDGRDAAMAALYSQGYKFSHQTNTGLSQSTIPEVFRRCGRSLSDETLVAFSADIMKQVSASLNGQVENPHRV